MTVFIATIINGKINFGSDFNYQRLEEYLKTQEGKKFRFEKIQEKRSLNQNAYFWKYLEIIETETGNDTKSMHEYVKKYLTPKVERSIRILENGQWKEHKGMIGKGTSELTKLEMGDVLDKLCALTGVPLPDPTLLGYLPS